MSSIDTWPKPQWLVRSTDSADYNRYYLRLVIALWEDGKVHTLANRLGVTPNMLRIARHRGIVNHDLAMRIEKLFGRTFCPREIFCPEPELPQE